MPAWAAYRVSRRWASIVEKCFCCEPGCDCTRLARNSGRTTPLPARRSTGSWIVVNRPAEVEWISWQVPAPRRDTLVRASVLPGIAFCTAVRSIAPSSSISSCVRYRLKFQCPRTSAGKASTGKMNATLARRFGVQADRCQMALQYRTGPTLAESVRESHPNSSRDAA